MAKLWSPIVRGVVWWVNSSFKQSKDTRFTKNSSTPTISKELVCCHACQCTWQACCSCVQRWRQSTWASSKGISYIVCCRPRFGWLEEVSMFLPKGISCIVCWRPRFGWLEEVSMFLPKGISCIVCWRPRFGWLEEYSMFLLCWWRFGALVTANADNSPQSQLSHTSSLMGTQEQRAISKP